MPEMIDRIQRTTGQRAQSIVEFSLMLPVLILFFAAAVDLGNGYQTWINLTNAAREGAYKASSTSSYSLICGNAAAELAGTGITLSCASGSAVTVSYPGASGADVGCAVNVRAAGCPVRVAVAYDMPMLAGQVFGISTISIHAHIDMVVFTP